MCADQVVFFKEQMQKTLNRIFFDKKIKSPAAYFEIWMELRKSLEDELSIHVSPEIESELHRIKNG